MSVLKTEKNYGFNSWLKHNKENFLWVGIIVGIAAFALGLGAWASRPDIYPDFSKTKIISPLATDFQGMALFIALSFTLGLLLTIMCALPLGFLRAEEKKKLDLATLRKTLLVVAVFITLFGVGMIMGSTTLRNCPSFNYEKNAHFYSLEQWQGFETRLKATLAGGSLCLLIGGVVLALALLSSLPAKIAAWIEAKRHQASLLEAKLNTEAGET